MPSDHATSTPDLLAEALLAALARQPDGVSLPRLRKRLGVPMSVLLRTLAWLSEAEIGGQRGAGLVRVERRGEVDVAVLLNRPNAGATSVAAEQSGRD